MYIVLEGVVGAGKSTQAKVLHTYLANKYPDREVLLVREPGGTPIAENIRKTVNATDYGNEQMHPLTDVFLFVAARAQLLYTVVQPALERGAIVISDRSFITSLVYQGFTQGLGVQQVRDANYQVIKDCLPECVIFFNLSVETGYARTYDALGDKREKKDISFFHKVYAGYQELFNFPPTKKMMHRVDASGSIEEVHKEIVAVIEKLPG